MIRSGIRTLVLFVAFAAMLTGAAAAQSAPQSATPTLRANVTISGPIVHIGDLVENAGAVADVPIFRSPDLGSRGTVSTDAIVEAIRPHQLVDIDTRGLAEVVVTRASRAISAQDISATIAQALAGQYGLSDAANIAVTFDRDVRALQVEADAAGDLEVLALHYDQRSGRFDALLDLPTSAELHRQPARFAGTAVETVAAVSVDHPVARGEVLKASDLTIIRRPKTDAATAPGIGDIADAAGLSARHDLRPGQPLHAADLMKPEVVQRNDTVTIVYEAPGIVLTLRGQAQEAGAIGDSINVMNVESKRVVQGIVSAPGRVTVRAAITRLVENSPSAMAAVPSAQEQSE